MRTSAGGFSGLKMQSRCYALPQLPINPLKMMHQSPQNDASIPCACSRCINQRVHAGMGCAGAHVAVFDGCGMVKHCAHTHLRNGEAWLGMQPTLQPMVKHSCVSSRS